MAAAFVGVDWGTSNARFMLVDASGQLIEERSGPGIAKLDGAAAIEDACFEALGDWPVVPVVMAGMVGSNIGWRPALYVKTPAKAHDVGENSVRFDSRGRNFALIPGVETIRADGFPDFMRGEEAQIHGAVGDDSALVCLPGTHAKWVVVANGAITSFHTALTGELMDIVGRHSILLHPKRSPEAEPDAVFGAGIAAIRASVLGLESMIFTVRSRQISGALSADAADAYLAGLCIGADVRSSLALHPDARSVTLIGAPSLTTLYAAALVTFGVPSRQIDGRHAVLSGLNAAYRTIFR